LFKLSGGNHFLNQLQMLDCGCGLF